jgi:hypothetical protein
VTVRAVYRPKVELHSVELVRDGNIEIEGEGLRGRSNLAMRAVFSKIFPKERPWMLVAPKVFEDARLADMGVTQFVIRDGWMGASIGPRRKEQSALETVGPGDGRPRPRQPRVAVAGSHEKRYRRLRRATSAR